MSAITDPLTAQPPLTLALSPGGRGDNRRAHPLARRERGDDSQFASGSRRPRGGHRRIGLDWQDDGNADPPADAVSHFQSDARLEVPSSASWITESDTCDRRISLHTEAPAPWQ